MNDVQSVPRTCGECTACCEALALDVLKKPHYLRCENLCEAGCRIYAERPSDCRSFECGWVEGFLSDEDRPDKLGMIVVTKTRRVIVIHEVRQGTFQTEKVRHLSEQFPNCNLEMFFHKDIIPDHRNSLFILRENLDQIEDLVQRHCDKYSVSPVSAEDQAESALDLLFPN